MQALAPIFQMWAQWHSTQAAFPDVGPEAFPEELETADQAALLAIEAMAAQAWSMSLYSMTMPHSCAIGLHEELTSQDRACNNERQSGP